MSVPLSAIVRAVLCPLLCLAVWTAAQAQTDAQESARREAAADFVLPQAIALGILRRECRRLLQAESGPDAIARAWWERNRDSLDASLWVIGEAPRGRRAQGSAAQATPRERRKLQAFSDSALQGLRTTFARELPSAAHCAQALERFRHEAFDVAMLGSTPGSEAFAEFAATLKRVRADPRYRAPDDKLRTFEAQVAVAGAAVLTQDAIDAALARGDSASVVRIYEGMAAEGDTKAAMSLAMLYLRGRLGERNPQQAAGWLYNAWAMGNPEGLNALGVFWRDGLAGAPDKTLALAAFAMAQGSVTSDARTGQLRAAGNLSLLMSQSDAAELAAAGCLRLSAVHDAARKLAAAAPGLSLATAPDLPTGTLFDNATLDPKLRGETACAK